MHTVWIHFLILARTQISVCHVSENNTITFPDSLRYFCPLADFCSKTSNVYTISDGFEPCCQTCSCSPDCKLTHNCCHDSFASDEYTDYSNCEYPGVTTDFDLEEDGTTYWMIDKCPDSSTDCRNTAVAPWGNIYPVTSWSRKETFINNHCAICHNVTDVAFWNMKFICKFTNYNHNLGTMSFEEFMQGSRDCSVEFYPYSIDNHRPEKCYKNVEHGCKPHSSEEHRLLCKSFNATFIFKPKKQKSGQAFGNVYCALCNIHDEHQFHGLYESECPVETDNTPSKDFFTHTIVSIIDYEVLNETLSRFRATTKEAGTDNEFKACGLAMDQNETSCRALLCPEGQIQVGTSHCRYFSSQWVNVKMAMLIKLTYHPKSGLVPIKCLLDELTSLPSNNILLRLPNVTGFSYIFFFQPSPDLTYADYFVLRLSYNAAKTRQVDPAFIFSNIQTALKGVWEFSACGEIYMFSSQINRDVSYGAKKSPFFPVMSYFPMWSIRERRADYASTMDLHLLPATRVGSVSSLYDGLWLTTTFFCNQIQLYAHEFKDLEYRIYIVNPGVYLGDGEYRRIRVQDGADIIKVCVDQYLQASAMRLFPSQPSFFGFVSTVWAVKHIVD